VERRRRVHSCKRCADVWETPLLRHHAAKRVFPARLSYVSASLFVPLVLCVLCCPVCPFAFVCYRPPVSLRNAGKTRAAPAGKKKIRGKRNEHKGIVWRYTLVPFSVLSPFCCWRGPASKPFATKLNREREPRGGGAWLAGGGLATRARGTHQPRAEGKGSCVARLCGLCGWSRCGAAPRSQSSLRTLPLLSHSPAAAPNKQKSHGQQRTARGSRSGGAAAASCDAAAVAALHRRGAG
jgi:hypothetical protein